MSKAATNGNKKTITVGLLWHSLISDNLGVAALSESHIAIINSAAKHAGLAIRYIIFGTSGNRVYLANTDTHVTTGERFGPKKILLRRSKFITQLKQCDVLFDIGEGDSFTDIYGIKRFVNLIGSKMAVLSVARPLILSPQTIGPFERKFGRWLASKVMRKCQKVYARDELSYNYLQSLGLKSNTDLAIDVAFRLPYHKLERSNSDHFIKVGLNVSGLLYNGGYIGLNQFSLVADYPSLTHNLLNYFLNSENCQVHLISHVCPDNLPRDNDYSVCLALHREHSNTVLVDKFSSPVDAKSYISSMDFFIGARMHACIAAFSSGVPVVPLSYSRKFNGLFLALEYEFFGDCKTQDNESLLTLVQDCFERRAELQARTVIGNAIADKRLGAYEQFVTETLKNLSHPPQ